MPVVTRPKRPFSFPSAHPDLTNYRGGVVPLVSCPRGSTAAAPSLARPPALRRIRSDAYAVERFGLWTTGTPYVFSPYIWPESMIDPLVLDALSFGFIHRFASELAISPGRPISLRAG